MSVDNIKLTYWSIYQNTSVKVFAYHRYKVMASKIPDAQFQKKHVHRQVAVKKHLNP